MRLMLHPMLPPSRPTDRPRQVSADRHGWALAVWMTQPNDRLLGHSPVDLLGPDLQAVLRAARQDRFVAG